SSLHCSLPSRTDRSMASRGSSSSCFGHLSRPSISASSCNLLAFMASPFGEDPSNEKLEVACDRGATLVPTYLLEHVSSSAIRMETLCGQESDLSADRAR